MDGTATSRALARRLAWAGVVIPLVVDLVGVALGAILPDPGATGAHPAGTSVALYAVLAFYLAGWACALAAQRILDRSGDLDPSGRRGTDRLVNWGIALGAVHVLLVAYGAFLDGLYFGAGT
ncbi:MAG: hypothetical protein AB7V62_04885 [Thermoleophilia bacterium]